MEDMTPYQEKLDLNSAMNKDERVLESYSCENHTPKNMMELDSNKENSGSPVPQDSVNNDGDPVVNFSTADDSCLAVESNIYSDDVDSRPYSDHVDGTIPIEDGHYHEDKELVQCVATSGNTDFAAKNSIKEIANEEADAPSQKQLSAMDNHNDWRIEASDHQNKDTHPFEESANSQLEKTELLSQEMGGGNFSPQNEMDADMCTPRMLPSDNGKDNGERYYSSPQRGRTDTPSPERQFSVSREKSPHIHSSARQEEFTNSDKKLMHSPDSSRHKQSPSPEKHVVGRKRASSHDRSSPPTKRKSPSGRMSRRDSHHRDFSPRRHSSRSPPRRDSPRRRGRSASRSPVRGRESYRRENRGRSRSRSPYQRDRPRKSPRYSSRRRSPPAHHSHRRSPRRAWSPPANRSTGIGKPGRNLFVAGFSYTTSERDLEKKFSRFGRVMDVRIVRDKRSGDSRGFGFLSLERDEDADAAIRALDQTEWNSRIILVEKSKTSVR